MQTAEDPKFRNSRFLQFVSKMSQGQIDMAAGSSGAGESWAAEFSRGPAAPEAESWAKDLALEEQLRSMMARGTAAEQQEGGLSDAWADAFTRELDFADLSGLEGPLDLGSDPLAARWADEFGRGSGAGAFGSEAERWAEQLEAEQQRAEERPGEAPGERAECPAPCCPRRSCRREGSDRRV